MRDREIFLTLHGDPIAKARARLRYGFRKRFFDPQHYDKISQRIELERQFGALKRFDGPVHMDLTFYMPIMRSTQYKANAPMFYKPDLDNLIKWICDVMQSVVYSNDCIVSELNSKKLYGDDPRTEIYIKELPYVQKEPKRRKLTPKKDQE